MRNLIRRAGACLFGMTLVLTGLVVAAPQAGAKTPVVASGTIECQSWTATAKFAPPLVFGVTGTSTMSFSGTFSDCGDTAGVTTGRVSGSATLPTDCTQDLNSSQSFNLSSVKYQIKWHGMGKFADTHGGSLTDGYFSEIGPQSAATAGLLFLDGIDPSTTGSFAGSGGGFLFGGQSTETPTQLGINCSSENKGAAWNGRTQEVDHHQRPARSRSLKEQCRALNRYARIDQAEVYQTHDRAKGSPPVLPATAAESGRGRPGLDEWNWAFAMRTNPWSSALIEEGEHVTAQ